MSTSTFLTTSLLLLLLHLSLHPSPASSQFLYSNNLFTPPLPPTLAGLPSPLLLNISFPRPEGQRWFWMFLSSKVQAFGTAVPLTFSFHGYGGTATSSMVGNGLQAAAEAGGWAAIAGQGTLGPSPTPSPYPQYGWNAGTCCLFQSQGAPVYQPDDVMWTMTALQATTQLLQAYNITVDTNRVFTMGMSNGGMMSERLGCERPDVFRAIASVTGATVLRPNDATWLNHTLSFQACDAAYAAATVKQSRPFSVLHVHGTADPTVPWLGGTQLDFPPVPQNMDAWYQRLGCNNATLRQTLQAGNFTNQLWVTCAYPGSQTELVRVAGGVHTWFNVPGTFSATDYALDFFSRQPVAPAVPHFLYDAGAGSFSPALPASLSDLPRPMIVNVSFARPEGERWFYLFLSSKAVAAAPLAVPLTFHFHGYTSPAVEGLVLDQAAIEAAGWALIAGQGSEGPRPFYNPGHGWNAGTCCLAQQPGAPVYEPDDVAWTMTALAAAKAMLSKYAITVDPDRVFTMGMSNGGMMSERLGCERPDVFRAVASVTGATVLRPAGATWLNHTLSFQACDAAYAAATSNQSRPLSVLHVHGTADPAVLWNGGGARDWPTVPDNMYAWAGRLGCSNASYLQTLSMGDFSNTVWPDCARKGSLVELVRVQGGVHTWWVEPGTFMTTDYAVQFFQAQGGAGGDGGGGEEESHAGTVVAVVVLLLVLAAAIVGGVVLYRRRQQSAGGSDSERVSEADVPRLSSSSSTGRQGQQYQQRLLD